MILTKRPERILDHPQLGRKKRIRWHDRIVVDECHHGKAAAIPVDEDSQ